MLAGDESAAFSLLIEHLRKAAEAAKRGEIIEVARRLEEAQSPATELGIYRSQRSWVLVADRLARVRSALLDDSIVPERLAEAKQTIGELIERLVTVVQLLRLKAGVL